MMKNGMQSKKIMKNSNVRTLKTLTYMMKYYDFITLEAPPTLLFRIHRL